MLMLRGTVQCDARLSEEAEKLFEVMVELLSSLMPRDVLILFDMKYLI